MSGRADIPASWTIRVAAVCLLAASACASPEAPSRDLAGASSGVSCAAGADAPARLRLGIAGSSVSAIRDDGWKRFAAEVEARLGRPVDLAVGETYDDLVGMIERGEVDVAVTPPLAYVRARERTPCLRLLLTMVSRGDVHFSGYIVVRRDSGMTSVRDLAGRRIGFGDRRSASGFLFPMARLIEAGFDAGRVLADARFLGDHLEVLRAVINGQVDAGASFYGALKAGRVRGIDVSGLRVLAVTGRIPFDAVVARPGLDPAVAASVTAVLDRLNGSSPEARAALSGLLDVDGFVPSDDSFYDPVRAMLKAVRAAGVEAP